MLKIKYLIPTLLLIFTVNSFAKETGMAFLNMPTSATNAATMTVFTSEPGSALNLFDNPVGIINEKTNVNFTNNFWFADVNQSVFTLGKNSKWGTFGLGLNFVNAPGFEVRSKPSDEPEGEINAHFFTGALGFSRKILKKVYFGVNTKYLFQSLYTEDASGFAMDFSLMWKMPSHMNLTFGLHNIGSMSELNQDKTILPSTMKIGLVRPVLFTDPSQINGSLGIYFDQNLIADKTEIKVGGEIRIYNMVKLRGGYAIKGQYNRLSFGLGLKLKKINFDFAMLMMDEIPDYPLIFTLSYDL